MFANEIVRAKTPKRGVCTEQKMKIFRQWSLVEFVSTIHFTDHAQPITNILRDWRCWRLSYDSGMKTKEGQKFRVDSVQLIRWSCCSDVWRMPQAHSFHEAVSSWKACQWLIRRVLFSEKWESPIRMSSLVLCVAFWTSHPLFTLKLSRVQNCISPEQSWSGLTHNLWYNRVQ